MACEVSPQESRLMCSYFEPSWEEKDMEEIKEHGFDTVVFCVTENDLTEDLRNLSLVVKYAKEGELDCWVDLWAFGGVFGGEAPSKFAVTDTACFRNPAFLRLLHDGIDYAKELGATTIFWDEPHGLGCECCNSKEVDVLRDLSAHAGRMALRNSICLTSSAANMEKLRLLARLPAVNDIGTDPYYTNFPGHNNDLPAQYVGRYSKAIANIAQETGKTGHIWVQGFDLLDGWEDIPLMAAREAAAQGIKNIGFWGYRACQATPEIAPANPVLVWENTRQLREITITEI